MAMVLAPGPSAPPTPEALSTAGLPLVPAHAVLQIQFVVVVFAMLSILLCLMLRNDKGGESFAEAVRHELQREAKVAVDVVTHPIAFVEHLFESCGPPPLIICGPSGAGKGTLIGKLQKEFPGKFGFSISHTTRQPRKGPDGKLEVNGREYHFSTMVKMSEMKDRGDFVEDAEVHGNMYGTSKAAVEAVQREGSICILDIDMQGARQVKANAPFPGGAKFVFVEPPSQAVLEKRLRARGTEDEEKIQKRLKNAVAECEFGKQPGFFDATIVNADLEKATTELRDKILSWYPTVQPKKSRDLFGGVEADVSSQVSPQKSSEFVYEGRPCTIEEAVSADGDDKALITYLDDDTSGEVLRAALQRGPPPRRTIIAQKEGFKERGEAEREGHGEVKRVMGRTFCVYWADSKETQEDADQWEKRFDVVGEAADPAVQKALECRTPPPEEDGEQTEHF